MEVVDWPRVFDQKSVIRDVQSILRHEHVDIISYVEVVQSQAEVKLRPNWKRLELAFFSVVIWLILGIYYLILMNTILNF